MPISNATVKVVRPQGSFISKQNLPNFEGVSLQTVGSKHLCMHMVVVPPGGRAESHYHDGYETVIYVLKGRAKTVYGENLDQEIEHQPGDFIYIPPNVPHYPVNLSDTEEVVAIVARNDPNEQESVVLYP